MVCRVKKELTFHVLHDSDFLKLSTCVWLHSYLQSLAMTRRGLTGVPGSSPIGESSGKRAKMLSVGINQLEEVDRPGRIVDCGCASYWWKYKTVVNNQKKNWLFILYTDMITYLIWLVIWNLTCFSNKGSFHTPGEIWEIMNVVPWAEARQTAVLAGIMWREVWSVRQSGAG